MRSVFLKIVRYTVDVCYSAESAVGECTVKLVFGAFVVYSHGYTSVGWWRPVMFIEFLRGCKVRRAGGV